MFTKHPILFLILSVSAIYPWSFNAMANPCDRALLGAVDSVEQLGTAWQNAHWRRGGRPFRYYNEAALQRIVADDDLAIVAGQWMRMSSVTPNGDLADTTYLFLVSLADMRVKLRLPTPAGRPPMLDYLATVIEQSIRDQVTYNPTIDIELMKKTNQFFHIELGLRNSGDEHRLITIANNEIVPRYHTLKMAQSFAYDFNSAEPRTELESDLLLVPNGMQLYRAKMAQTIIEVAVKDTLFSKRRVVRGVIIGLKQTFFDPLVLEIKTINGKTEVPVDSVEMNTFKTVTSF